MKDEPWKRKMKDKSILKIHGGKGGNNPSIDYLKGKIKIKKHKRPIKIKRHRNMRKDETKQRWIVEVKLVPLFSLLRVQSEKTVTRLEYLQTGMELGLGVRGGRSINQKKKIFETPNKHSFNKPSTKKNTQNYCFLRYYNAVIYENGTRCLFKSSKSSMIEFVLIVAAMSLSMNNIIASDKNASSILLQRSILMTLIAENVRFVVALEKGRVSTSLTTL